MDLSSLVGNVLSQSLQSTVSQTVSAQTEQIQQDKWLYVGATIAVVFTLGFVFGMGHGVGQSILKGR